MQSESLLFIQGDFEYHILRPDYKDAAHVVLARAFCTEPVLSELGTRENDWETTFMDWLEFVNFWMEHCSTNGLSVIAISRDDRRVAGVFIVRDLHYMPDGFDEKYKSDDNKLTPWMGFLNQVKDEAFTRKPELLVPGNTVEFWFLGVHPDFRGNKIANYLIKGVLQILPTTGFKYGMIEATSAFTSHAARWNGFTEVYSMKTDEFLWKGKPIYSSLEGSVGGHGTWTFWMKELIHSKN